MILINKKLLRPVGITTVILKLLTGTLLASYFLRDLFIPFLNAVALSPLKNPWDFTLAHHIPKAFPYGPVMMYFMALPRIVLGWWLPRSWLSVTVGHLFISRIPLLVADFIIFYLLVNLLNTDLKRVKTIWWWSPVVFYISYIHGQLDLIPTMFLIASIGLLCQEHYFLSPFILGLGIASKSHLIIAVPFLAVYVYRKENSLWKGFLSAGLSLATYIFVLFPWVLDKSFQKMVFGTDEQLRLFAVGLDYQINLRVFLAPLVCGILFTFCHL